MITNGTVIMYSFFAVLLKLSISYFVYKRSPESKVNRLFALMFFCQAVWDFGKGMTWLSTDMAIALIYSKISYASYIISVFIFPDFVWNFLKRKNLFTRHIKIWYGVMSTLLILVFVTPLVVSGLLPPELSQWGFGLQLWQVTYGKVYQYFFLWFQALVFIYTWAILLQKYFMVTIKQLKDRLRWFVIGLSFPILIGIPTGVVLPALGIRIFPHNNILTTLMSLSIGYGILKYKFLSVAPLYEEGRIKVDKKELNKFPLRNGSQYLVCTKDSERSSYNVMLDKLSKKCYGLIITTKKPSDVRKKYGIKTTPIIWLTDSETDELAIGSTDIEQLHATIENFSKLSNSYVLLDGLAYLITKNSFSKIIFLARSLRSIVYKNKSVLLLPSEKYDLAKKQENMLVYEYVFLPRAKSFFDKDQKILSSKNAKFVALGYDSAIESLLQEIGKNKITILSPNVENKKEKNITFVKENPLKKRNLDKYIGDNYVVFISLINDSDTIFAINLVRAISERATVVANIHRANYVEIAEKAGADYVVPSSTLGGHLLAMAANNPNIIRWIMDAVTHFDKGIELAELSSKKFVGKSVVVADNKLGKEMNIVGVKSRDYLHQVPQDSYIIQKEDVLLVVKRE